LLSGKLGPADNLILQCAIQFNKISAVARYPHHKAAEFGRVPGAPSLRFFYARMGYLKASPRHFPLFPFADYYGHLAHTIDRVSKMTKTPAKKLTLAEAISAPTTSSSPKKQNLAKFPLSQAR
jgi:hypothetical protein